MAGLSTLPMESAANPGIATLPHGAHPMSITDLFIAELRRETIRTRLAQAVLAQDRLPAKPVTLA